METYSITNDFSGIFPDLQQLENEIADNSNISPNVLYSEADEDSDKVDIFFDLSLSGSEKIELDGLISSHISLFKPIPNKEIVIDIGKNTKSSSYKRLLTKLFPATSYAKAKIVSYMSSGATSYDILIYDKTNKQILLETNLSNTNENIQELGEFSNLSNEISQIEILVKKVGGNNSKKIFVESIIICYISL